MRLLKPGQVAVLLLLLAAAFDTATADTLASLPPDWSEKLLPVAEIGLENLDADSREQIGLARSRVAAAIDSNLPQKEIADAYGELGALYHVQFVYSLANDCYANAQRLDPDNFRWNYYPAYLAINSGELERAVAGLEKARQLRPGYLAVTQRLADTLLELNRLDAAKQAYLSVVEAEGLGAAAHYGLGQIALLQRDYPAAIEHFTRALDMQPEADRIHYPLARALRAAGREEEARQHMARMGDRLPSFRDPQIESLQALKQGSRVHFINGMKAYRQLDYVATHQAFARGLEREPDNTSARISYARALYLAGEKQQAKQQLETTLATDPANAMACFLLGVLAEEEGDAAAAAEWHQRAIRHEPGHPGAHLQLGNQAFREGQFNRAVEHYAASMRSAPEPLALYLPYAGALLQSGADRSSILAIIDAAMQRFPDNPMLEYLYVQLLACPGNSTGCDPAQALERANRLAEQQRSPPHRELQALACAANGDFEQAVSIQQALATEAVWSMPFETTRLSANLESYQAGKLPAFDRLFTRAMLQAPPVQGVSVFRDYPAVRPY